MSKEIDLSRLSIKEIIVHDIPKHKQDDFAEEPMYSDSTSPLTIGLTTFFKQKVVDALKSDRALKVMYNDESKSPVRYLAENLYSKKAEFIQTTKDITNHLFRIQKGNNSGGLLLFMNCLLESERVLFILKLEKDSGVQLELNEGSHSFDLKEVKDLMLTYRTKLFKVAVLYDMDKLKLNYCGKVMDYQIDIKQKDTSSTFFISDFLGCIPFKDPKTTTKTFYTLTKTFIDSIDDEPRKAKYLQDLNSYLQMNKRSISGNEFAQDYMLVEHQDKYNDFMNSKNFKMEGFIKDTSMISNKIVKISMEFENGITLLGKDGTFKNKVKLTEEEGGKVRAVIVSKVLRIE